MFQAIREWVANNQRMAFLLGLLLLGSVALVLAGGLFDVQISRFFAVYNENIDGGGGGGTGTGTGAGATNEPCIPVAATSWSGSTDVCRQEQVPPPITPPPFPENWRAHITLANPNGLPSLATSAPYGGPDGYTCFGFTLPDGNGWAAVDARNGGTVPVPPGTKTLTGQFFNNCPWPVEMTGGAAGAPKAGSDFIFKEDGTTEQPWFGIDEQLTRETTQIIPSCWNYAHVLGSTTNTGGSGGGSGGGGGNGVPPLNFNGPYRLLGRLFGESALAQQANCTGTYTISFNVTFNAGRAEVNLGWVHHDGVGSAKGGGQTIIDGYTVIMDTGKTCSGATGETCATDVGGGGFGGGGSAACPGSEGVNGKGPGGAFNCGTGERSFGCWCGEWGDAIWAQRHAAAANTCSPGFVLTAEFKKFLDEQFPGLNPDGWAPDGTTAGDFLDWSRGEVQAFIDVMAENFVDQGGKECVPKNSCVDYAGIQKAYWAIGDRGWGLSDNGSSAVARICKDNVAIDPATLTAQCTGGNGLPVILNWNIPVGAVANSIIKRNITAGTEGQFVTGILDNATTYLDSDLEPGNTYSYTHKAHASVASEPVVVTMSASGVCSVQGASPSPTGTPFTSVPPSPTGTPGTVVITPPPGDDFDGDGVSDADECPTASLGYCQDSDGDGSPDFADATDGRIGGAAATATGPGEVTMVSLLLAALVALLYVSYTHTGTFRRREVHGLKEDQGPMDFRN
ncbi:MAG TPA: hypothetical protein VD862_02910 [Candidatus Paceibacterota bacterium]|nr:hypothetical protein [Candidatus Paceibacterota bacterium]